MAASDTSRVRFDADEITLARDGGPSPMTIAWTEIASIEAGCFARPKGEIRLLTLVHGGGTLFEVPYSTVGFQELCEELARRFELDAATRERLLSVATPAGVCIKISEGNA